MTSAQPVSEQRYRLLFESLDAAVLLMDGLRCIDCNPAALRLFGVGSREAIIGKTPLDFAPPHQPDGTDSAHRAREILATALERGGCTFEWQAIRPSGERFFMEVHLAPFSVGTAQLFQCIAFDVTERKRLELALRDAQAWLELATAGAKVGVWHSDLRTLVMRCSTGWKDMLGRSEGERSVASVWDLVHPDDRARATLVMQEHFQGRAPVYESTHRMLHADGSYRWVLSRGVTVRDAQGLPSGLFGADVDITERKTLEETLRRSEARYRHLVEDVSDIIYEADPEGRMTYVSPVAERLYGYAAGEVTDRSYAEFIFPDDLAVVAEGLRDALAGRPRPNDHRVITKTGAIRWVRNLARPIVDDGQVVGLRGVMADVTERKRAEDALRDLTISLEQQVAEQTRELAASHQRLRLITDNMSDLVSQVTMEAQLEYVSPAHERVLGYTPEQMLGRSAFDFLHPDDRETVAAVVRNPIDGSTFQQVEIRYRHALGHYVWLETTGKLLFDERGARVGAVLSGRDISQRKRADEALRQSEKRFRAIFEQAPLGVALVDSQSGRLLQINRRYCDILGRTERELVGADFRSLTHPDDRPANWEEQERLLRGESHFYAFEKRYLRPDGSTVWVNVTAVPMWAEGAAPTVQLAMVDDITERKQAAERIERLHAELEARVVARTAELQAVNKELEAFSYSVSHDLRAPLRAIDGFSRMLRDEHGQQLPAEGRHCVERVCAATTRMAQLIDDLLKLSRLQRSEVSRQPVDLSALARGIAAELQQAAPARVVDVVIAGGIAVIGDPDLLRVVLENLLGNAWKYTSKHATARIEFGVTDAGGRMTYFVRDDGAGFDMAYAEKLFGPFKRLHTAHEFEGTGIGLAIVQRIIARHGGQVWAEAKVERGATFYFTLPAPVRR